MADPIPTQVGDVLILESPKASATYVVGAIANDGDQRLGANYEAVRGRRTEESRAKELVMDGCSIYLVNTSTKEWQKV